MLINIFRSGMSMKEILLSAIIMFIALTVSFAVHEFAHAFVAYKFGDDTPYNMGRVTLNPLAHVDPMGTVMLLLFGFGWGKPVPVNASRFNKLKSKRAMRILVDLAGVIANLLLALVASLILGSVFGIIGLRSTPVISFFSGLLSYIIDFSILLMAFNLIPIPPLDGSRVLDEIIPTKWKFSNGYMTFKRNAPQIFMMLIFADMIFDIGIISSFINIIRVPVVFVCNYLIAIMIQIL